MNTRRFTEADMPVIIDWFQDTKWPLPASPSILPKDGFVITENDIPKACAFVYLSGTGKADLSWINVDPKLEMYEAKKVLRQLVADIKGFIAAVNPKIYLLIVYTQDDSIAELLREEGFYSSPGFYRMTWMEKAT